MSRYQKSRRDHHRESRGTAVRLRHRGDLGGHAVAEPGVSHRAGRLLVRLLGGQRAARHFHRRPVCRDSRRPSGLARQPEDRRLHVRRVRAGLRVVLEHRVFLRVPFHRRARHRRLVGARAGVHLGAGARPSGAARSPVFSSSTSCSASCWPTPAISWSTSWRRAVRPVAREVRHRGRARHPVRHPDVHDSAEPALAGVARTSRRSARESGARRHPGHRRHAGRVRARQ